jgi:hypothetical protein
MHTAVQVKHRLGASGISVAAQELGFQPSSERGGGVLLLVALVAQGENRIPRYESAKRFCFD